MKTKKLGQCNATKSRKWFQRPRGWHDLRLARPEGSQFQKTGWIVQLVHTFGLVAASRFERTCCRRRQSGDPMLVFNMSPDRPMAGSYFCRDMALRVAVPSEVAGRPSYLKQVAALWAQSGSIFNSPNGRESIFNSLLQRENVWS
jgi:hypothetical protein